LKKSFLALRIVGILFVFSGVVSALQGDGLVGGSPMTGNPFWIYAGSGIAIVGAVIALVGFILGSRSRIPTKTVDTTASKMDGESDSKSLFQTKK
jgi:hypothetical protein